MKSILIKKLILILLGAGMFIANATHAQNALHFDGVNDYVDLGDSVGDSIRTIELWFKPDSLIDSNLADFQGLVIRNTTGCNNCNIFGLTFQPESLANSGTLRFFWENSTGTTQYNVYSDSDTWNAGQWYHVAAVIDGSQGMMLFIDGFKQTSTAANTVPTGVDTHITTIGRWGNINDRYFEGTIDDVRLSTNARYTSNFIPPCPDLSTDANTKGLWNLNEGSGTVADDASANDFDGTIHGATWVTGRVCGSALHFDGIDDYVDLGDTVGDSIRTIELWFKTDSLIDSTISDFAALVVRHTNGCNNCNIFGLTFQPTFLANAGTLRFFWENSTGTTQYNVYSDTNAWTAGQWYHVAGVIDGSQGMMLFIDGVKQTSTAANTLPTGDDDDITTLGRWGNFNDRHFEGTIDDVRFSTSARYTSNFTPPCPDLATDGNTKGLWNLNENNGVFAYDASGNDFHGDVYGANWVTPYTCHAKTDEYNATAANIASESSLRIFPNPGSGDLNFEVTGVEGNATVHIYTLTGSLLKSINLPANRPENWRGTLEFSNMEPGIYLISLESKQGRNTQVYTRL